MNSGDEEMHGKLAYFMITVAALYITACSQTESPNPTEPEPVDKSETVVVSNVKPYSPAVGQDFPTNVYFGDTHLHTNISLDAYGDGNTKIGPDEAYRFAKGETVIGDDGMATECPGRLTSSWWPTIPNIWASSRVLQRETNHCSRTKKALGGRR